MIQLLLSMYRKSGLPSCCSAAVLGIVCVFSHAPLTQPTKRPVTVEDCVRTRRIFEGQVALSPQGNTVAYVVISPDLATNQNRYLLYLLDLDRGAANRNGQLLLDTLEVIHGLYWSNASGELFVLEGADRDGRILEIDSVTKAVKQPFAWTEPISEFSADANGNKIVFVSTRDRSEDFASDYRQFGYPVLFGKGLEAPQAVNGQQGRNCEVFVASRNSQGDFEITNLETALGCPRHVRGLSVSPNGRFLVFSYTGTNVPREWQANPYALWCMARGIIPETLVLYDFQLKKLQTAFDAPSAAWGHPVVWAGDSQAFSLNALSPMGSVWENEDMKAGPALADESWPYYHSHSFSVDLRTMRIAQVEKTPAVWFLNGVVSWRGADDPLLVRRGGHRYEWFAPRSTDWVETGGSDLTTGDVNLYSAMNINDAKLNAVSDGKRIVGAFETQNQPPGIFVHDLTTGATLVPTDLNPELDEVDRASVEPLEWTERHGFHCMGFLIKPIGYEQGKRYPLVIMTKSWWAQYFLMDTEYHTAFPPEVLASSGFVVLLAQERVVEFERDRGRTFPGKYPGHVGEAAELGDIVSSAIDLLAQRGLAERSNVGLMGFSTTSWKVDMLLTRFGRTFRAASSADSGLWNYGLYWSSNESSVMEASSEYLGGPPFGKTLGNWLRFSPAFNATKMETPLLMEYMARGRRRIDGLEFYVALRSQGRRAELYFYPRGQHVLESPSERVASLQRNVDWFRFWMQGREGEAPFYDRDQYDRWRALKSQN